jgi:hypothetical protein
MLVVLLKDVREWVEQKGFGEAFRKMEASIPYKGRTAQRT